jgi:dihydrofolate reductase
VPVIDLIGNTTNRGRLVVRVRLDRRRYPTGKKISKQELRELKVEREEFHGGWNYVIRSRMEQRSPVDFAVPDRLLLAQTIRFAHGDGLGSARTSIRGRPCMRPLRYSINVTLDGCCDHRVMIADEELHRHAVANLERADALVFGRVTYEMMEAAWRPVARTGAGPEWMVPFARTIDAAKKYVVSSTLDRVDWNAELVRGDLREAVRQLKREPGEGLFVAGVKLALALADLGLIDEYEFVVHPVLAGHGPTLFAGLRERLVMTLVSRQEFRSGAVVLRYQPSRVAA